ncbi:hypothetical protein [Paraflavitalea speifideaquila]|uniref:hypothetical protein n=1 Tax=Paraflavitalea speifideaquila TaxID=3076558 RepID=UPI0028F08451|nr:hypothetical protein [Paraflavitalea speifideiaquila]
MLGKAGIITEALIKAPNNTINFFGRGNESEFNKTGNFKNTTVPVSIPTRLMQLCAGAIEPAAASA